MVFVSALGSYLLLLWHISKTDIGLRFPIFEYKNARERLVSVSVQKEGDRWSESV